MANIDEDDEINHRHNLVVQMAAAGMTQKAIAQEVGFTPTHVQTLMSKAHIKKRIADAQEKYWGKGIRTRMQSVARKALDQIEQLIDDPLAKCSTRLAASTYIVDQAVGKAQQNVAVQGGGLSELISRIDKMAVRDVAPLNALDVPRDALDTFVDDLIPESVTVGAKHAQGDAGSFSEGDVSEAEADETDY